MEKEILERLMKSDIKCLNTKWLEFQIDRLNKEIEELKDQGITNNSSNIIKRDSFRIKETSLMVLNTVKSMLIPIGTVIDNNK